MTAELAALDATLFHARAHALRSYDASYLQLALRERVPLATLDSKMREAGNAVALRFTSEL